MSAGLKRSIIANRVLVPKPLGGVGFQTPPERGGFGPNPAAMGVRQGQKAHNPAENWTQGTGGAA